MKKLLPLAAVAGALFLVAGTAQAAPVSSNVLGKMTTASDAGSVVEKAGYRHHHRKWWKKRYYKRHYRHHHRRHHHWR
jgi:hypothetical protein